MAVLDYTRSDRSCLSLGAMLQAETEPCGTRLLLVSSVGDCDEADRATDQGFDHYLPKPVGADVLSGWVDRLGRPDKAEIARPAAVAVDRRRVRVLLAEATPPTALLRFRCCIASGTRSRRSNRGTSPWKRPGAAASI
jgi:ActR/RegA family two-component response regulator